MKYLGYIFAIVLALSAAAGYVVLRKEDKKEQSVAVVINDRLISLERYKRLYKHRMDSSYHINNKKEFLDMLITKELLIQEAQKQGINKGEEFRMSIQDFYEQSLIKVLMEKKFSDLRVKVRPYLYERYIELMGKNVKLELFSYDSLLDAEKGDLKNGRIVESPFSQIGENYRVVLLDLKVGELSKPIASDNKFTVVRLISLGNRSGKINSISKDKVIALFKKHKKNEIVSKWLNELKEKATIKISKDI
jgi:hypothetical protein